MSGLRGERLSPNVLYLDNTCGTIREAAGPHNKNISREINLAAQYWLERTGRDWSEYLKMVIYDTNTYTDLDCVGRLLLHDRFNR